jgi:hypothetical protein
MMDWQFCPYYGDEKRYHEWEAGDGWGVIIGLSCCKKCGKRSRLSDFLAQKSAVTEDKINE